MFFPPFFLKNKAFPSVSVILIFVRIVIATAIMALKYNIFPTGEKLDSEFEMLDISLLPEYQ